MTCMAVPPPTLCDAIARLPGTLLRDYVLLIARNVSAICFTRSG